MTVIGADSTPDVDGVSGAESPERLVALSDGIYAIAMTLLVLDLSIPSGLSKAGFRHAMHQVWPNLGSYALSFAILAALWRNQRWLLHQLRRVDALTVRLSLAGLGAVALVPFPTALLSEYGAREPLAVSAYTAAIALINLLHLTLFLTVWRRRHLQARPIPDHVGRVTVAELGAVVLICAVSVVMAFAVSPRAGVGTWFVSGPVKHAIRWRIRTQRRT